MTRHRLLPIALSVLALGVVPAAAQAAEPGVVTATNQTVNEVLNAQALGAKWVRVFVDWSFVEPNKGSWNDADVKTRLDALHAAGVKTLVVFVLSPPWANGGSPNKTTPPDPQEWATAISEFAKRNGASIDAYEEWNEPDGSGFWLNGPDPVRYAALLRAAYVPLKAAAPQATIVTGGTVGNDADFVQALYQAGAKGSFDAIGVHTDTACLSRSADYQYRDEKGRIGRYVFTGYREVHQTMLDNGDTRPIWMTELGWSTPGGQDLGSTKCVFAGTPLKGKENDPGGVGYSDQAKYLTQAYQCLQPDTYVEKAIWYAAQDTAASHNSDDSYGLMGADKVKKPSWNAFHDWAAAPSAAGSCGEPVDRVPPTIKVLSPTPGMKFATNLPIEATATDNLTVSKMEAYADDQKIGGQQSGAAFTLNWLGASKLRKGAHVITIKAYDGAKNVAVTKIDVRKVDASQISVTPAVLAFTVGAIHGRRVSVSGRLTTPGSKVKPKGKIEIVAQIKRGGAWKTISHYGKGVSRPFRLTITLKKAGTWRIFARYVARKPYKSVRSPYHAVRAR